MTTGANNQQAFNDYRNFVASVLAKKGGADLSSMTMDPIQQYLLGTFQPEQFFDINQLYERLAPTVLAAATDGNTAFGDAAAKIKSGVSPWTLWGDVALQKQSGMTPEDWKDFINALASENQAVKRALLDQSIEQDVFEKAGMSGADSSWIDRAPDGTLRYAGHAVQYAPESFKKLLDVLPAQLTADKVRYAEADKLFGGPIMITDEAKKREYLTKQVLEELRLKAYNKVHGEPMKDEYGKPIYTDQGKAQRTGVAGGKKWYEHTNYGRNSAGDALPFFNGSRLSWSTFNPFAKGSSNPDVPLATIEAAFKQPLKSLLGTRVLLDRLGISLGANNPKNVEPYQTEKEVDKRMKQNVAGVEDKAASYKKAKFLEAYKAYGDRLSGSGADTERRIGDLALNVLTSLHNEGSTPLLEDILKNALLRQSTNRG